MTGGVYCLVIRLGRATAVAVGSLGAVSFEAGWYVYVGSARGPGGFARVERHREVAAGDRDVRHWHVDSLLGHPAAAIEATITTAGGEDECAIAGWLSGERVPDVGCSDCDCPSHLARYGERARAVADAAGAHRAVVQSGTSR